MTDAADRLTKALIALTASWTDHEDIRKSEQHKCANIGRELNTLGGMNAMTAAYREAKAHNRAASVIQAYWHGIGDWQW